MITDGPWQYSDDVTTPDLLAYYSAVKDICDPKVLARVLNNESGFKNWIINWQGPHGHQVAVAGGIFQAINATLVGLGFRDGVEAFTKLSFQEQLPYLVKFYTPYAGKIHTDVQAYGVTFTPGLFSHYVQQDFDICAADGSSAWGMTPEKSKMWYAQNHGLDTNHDGKITPSDFVAVLAHANSTARAQEINGRLAEIASSQV